MAEFLGTPGPYEVACGQVVAVADHSKWIAMVKHPIPTWKVPFKESERTEAIANGRLMAASYGMLAACQVMLADMEMVAASGGAFVSKVQAERYARILRGEIDNATIIHPELRLIDTMGQLANSR